MTKEIKLENVLNFYPDLKGVIKDPDKQILNRKSYDIKIGDSKDGIYDVIMSQQVIDRDSEVIVTAGINYDFYNNVVCWAHDLSQLPIGKVLEIHKTDTQLYGKIQFAIDYAFARDVEYLVRNKFLQGISIGYLPTQSLGRKDKGFSETCRRYGIEPNKCTKIILQCSLLEVSLVPVAANQLCKVKGYKPESAEGQKLLTKLESKSQEQTDKKVINMDMIDKLQAMMVAFQGVIDGLKPQEVEIEVETVPTETQVEQEAIKPTETAPTTEAIVAQTDAVIDESKAVTEEPKAVVDVVPTETINTEGCTDKPKEEVKVEVPTETKSVEQPKPTVQIKVLRVGGLQVDESIKTKALKFLAGKPY